MESSPLFDPKPGKLGPRPREDSCIDNPVRCNRYRLHKSNSDSDGTTQWPGQPNHYVAEH
jgi:hypothetical protein